MSTYSVQQPKSRSNVTKRKEESSHYYGFGGYCPLSFQQLLKDGRYVLIRKMGFGMFSTVWLAYDMKEESHCALKVVRASQSFMFAALEEIQMLKHIGREAKSSQHPGKDFIVRMRDHFKHYSPNGQHIVIVQEILSESLRSFLDHNEPLSLPVVKHLARELLQAIDFLHSETQLINTDLKTANLLVSLHDPEDTIRSDPELSKLSEDAIRHARGAREVSPSRKPNAVPINAAIRRERGHSNSFSSLHSKPHEIVRSLPITSPPVAYRVRFDTHRMPGSSASVSPTSSSFDTASSYVSSSSKSPWNSDGSRSAISRSDLPNSHSPAVEISPDQICSSISALKLLAEEKIKACEECASVKTQDTATRSHLQLPRPPKGSQEITRPKSSHGVVEWEDRPFSVKMCDLGNATPIDAHASYDIQTLEYRAPEVLLGKDWTENVDIWSLGCILFECATGDLLFNPAEAAPLPHFTKEDDMLAQMQELAGREYPPEMLENAAYASRYFNPKGKLRRIKALSFWPLYDVLQEKYLFDKADALRFSSFLEKMLTFDGKLRPSAKELLDDPFLTSASYDPPPPRSSILQRTLSMQSVASSQFTQSTPDLVASMYSDRSSCSSPVLTLVAVTASFQTGLSDLCSGPWDKSQALTPVIE